MASRNKSPPHKRRTPTNFPELLEVWKSLYQELHVEGDMKKYEALKEIGKQYDVSYQTVMYHIFDAYKAGQKERPSIEWSYKKRNTDIHKQVIGQARKYQGTRNHIDDIIRQGYERISPEYEMSLEKMSAVIYDICSISFHPVTISNLVKRLESTKGIKLLIEVPGSEPMLYRLAD